jgi:DNA invertase Pin-like site-specific DNA recombinase
MRVAIYSRVSTDRQEVDNQLGQLREYCSRQGWAIIAEYVDIASGGKSDREQFKAMFAAASRRQFDCLLFWSLDRLSREGVLETLQHLQRLTAYNVAYKSYSEQYLDSLGPFKDAVLAILACIARQEKVRIRERTMAGLARARAKGRIGGRPRAINDAHRERVLQLRASGLSFGAIAKQTGFKKSTVHLYCAGA